jgi:site-specific DNA-methyltransferase (cytosine-N4-specific)
MKLAKFLIEFLTEPGQIVVDPFFGSGTVPHAAEELGRRWVASECIVEYVLGSATRFIGRPGFEHHLLAA